MIQNVTGFDWELEIFATGSSDNTIKIFNMECVQSSLEYSNQAQPRVVLGSPNNTDPKAGHTGIVCLCVVVLALKRTHQLHICHAIE